MNLKLNHPVAFVPTMGALHAGHESLINIAKKLEEEVVVSIFVNPLQFDNPDDFSTYPNTIEQDIVLAKASGSTFVWQPTLQEIYPDNPKIIPAGEVGEKFEGVHRFGHFDGVLTVVNRLFELVRPKFAVFGEKDFQQLFLIKRMVSDLKLPIEIISAPTIRGASGLALSSRNNKLSAANLDSAAGIFRALEAAKMETSLETTFKTLKNEIMKIPSFLLDYAEIIDESNFELADKNTGRPRAIVAGWINGVRLIDNMVMQNLANTVTRK